MPPYSAAYGGYRRAKGNTRGMRASFAGTSGRRSAYMGRSGLGARFTRARSRPSRALTELIRTSAGEKKGCDTSLAIAGPIVTTVDTNADIVAVNLMVPGNGSFNRIGRKVFMKSLRLKGQAVYQQTRFATSHSVYGSNLRCIVVYDRQPNSSAYPTFNEIFGHTKEDGTEATYIMDSLKYDNMQRFRVLKEFVIQHVVGAYADPDGTENSIFDKYHFDEYVKLPNLETTYSGTAAANASIATGALYVIWRADAATNGYAEWSITNATARLRFCD